MSEPLPSDQQSDPNASPEKQRQAFEEAANAREMGIVQEFILFLRENKAWWLVPIFLALALIGLAAWLSSSAAAPFIYPLF